MERLIVFEREIFHLLAQWMGIFRKEADLMAASSKLEEEQSLVSKLQKQIKDLETRWESINSLT